MLAFYDELRRRGRTIDALDRNIGDTLEAGRDTDRGAERLLQQTRFLAAAFAAFERRIADSGRIDEHGLRTLLLADAVPLAVPASRDRRSPIRPPTRAASGRSTSTCCRAFAASSGSTSSPPKRVLARRLARSACTMRCRVSTRSACRRPSAAPVLVAPPLQAAGRRAAGRVRVPRSRGRAGRGRPANQAARPRRHGDDPRWSGSASCSSGRCRTSTWRGRCSRPPAFPYQAVRRAAAGRRAVRGGARSALRGRGRRRDPRVADRAARVAALDVPRSAQPAIARSRRHMSQRSIGCCRSRSSSAAGTSWRGSPRLAAAAIGRQSRDAARGGPATSALAAAARRSRR